jgi:hypothetical protein
VARGRGIVVSPVDVAVARCGQGARQDLRSGDAGTSTTLRSYGSACGRGYPTGGGDWYDRPMRNGR